MPNFNTIWPVASFALGAALTQFNSYLTEKRQRIRDRESRQYELSKGLLEGKRSFEIEVLGDLYKCLTSLNDAVDVLRDWHNMDENGGSVEAARELCSRLQGDVASAWRLNGLLFDSQLSDFVGDVIGQELFPSGPEIVPARRVLEAYGDKVWDAHDAVAAKLKSLYEAV
ncbi:hypothetical protein ACWCPJ_23585 [Streptomyces collinus]